MLKVNVYSNNFLFIKVIKKFFIIKNVFSDKPFNHKFKEFCKTELINFNYVIHKKNLKISFVNNIDLGLSFGFGLIFNENYIKQFKYGIWNFHTGDLPKYRGRHPITWAFLNDEKRIALSIHSINQKIDQGNLIHKYFVKRTYYDDENSILDKIAKKFYTEIPKAIKNFFSNNIKKLSKGTYYPSLIQGIKKIESKKTNSIYAYNAAKAQKTHSGIQVDEHFYKDAFFFKKDLKIKNSQTIKFKDNKKLILLKK